MKVRLIAGQFGGRVIEGSATNRTHPMSERIRNAIFNSLGDVVVGARVLDAFAGSGALGLEAVSRGAQQAVFIEKDRVAAKLIEQNFTLLGLPRADAQVRCIQAPLVSVLARLDQTFDIIFADPPYHDPQLPAVARLYDFLAPGGLLVLSHPDKTSPPQADTVTLEPTRDYGNAHISFVRRPL